MMTADDLRDPATLAHDADAFPPELPLENRALPLAYAYKPGQADDGVTLNVNVREAETLTPAALDWAVPGHLEAKIEHYLRALPKELRRAFVPLAETVRSVSVQVAQRDRLTGRRESLTDALAAQLRERFRIGIDPLLWQEKPLPDHLRVRVCVLDDADRELCASRELGEIHAALAARKRAASAAVAREEPEAWRRARTQWEKSEQTTWTFGDIPERVSVADQGGVPVSAFPGLKAGKEGVALRLFRTPEEARAATGLGLAQLLERELSRDLGWLQRDLKGLSEVGTLAATLAPMPQLQTDAFESIKAWICDPERMGRNGSSSRPADLARPVAAPGLLATAFAAALERAKSDLRGLVPRLTELVREILTLRQTLLIHPQPYLRMEQDLAALLPSDFLRATPFAQLAHFPRYLKAMKLRADRWKQNPAKDTERVRQLAPYAAAMAKLAAEQGSSSTGRFRWSVEEFRVSLFAQELGTAEPVSVVKLDRALAELDERSVLAEGPAEPKRASPERAFQLPEKKPAPVKNFGALDKLFPR